MKQMSGGTVTVVLSKQATHAPRLTLHALAPCRARVPPKCGIISHSVQVRPMRT